MARFLIYDNVSGLILRFGSVPDGTEQLQVYAGESIIINYDLNINPETYIIVNNIPVLKPGMVTSINKTFIKANAIDSATILGVPVSTKCYVNGDLFENVDDGNVV